MTPLPRVPLGPRGMQVSRLCLGTMMFGDQTDAGEAAEIIAAFAEAGGSFIDTADVYAGGASERIVGNAIRGRRDEWVVATKVGNPVMGRDGSGGLTRGWIRTGCAESLERLGCDRVDLYYLHLDDETTPLEESLEAIGELLEEGLIGAWGFSNHRAWKIAEMVRIADALGIARPVVAQPYYHALYRLVEIDYLPACAHFGIGIVPYSPLARGVLTGKYAHGARPEGSRIGRSDPRIMMTEARPEALAAAERIVEHLADDSRTPTGFALGWVLANPLVSSLLIGPKSMEQLQDYLATWATQLSATDEAFIDQLVPPGCSAGAGYADPQYPYRGRPTSAPAG